VARGSVHTATRRRDGRAGLEAALVDKSPMPIAALNAADQRSVVVDVAGVAAMLVAKVHRIRHRIVSTRRDWSTTRIDPTSFGSCR
jgi:hypothetical protein